MLTEASVGRYPVSLAIAHTVDSLRYAGGKLCRTAKKHWKKGVLTAALIPSLGSASSTVYGAQVASGDLQPNLKARRIVAYLGEEDMMVQCMNGSMEVENTGPISVSASEGQVKLEPNGIDGGRTVTVEIGSLDVGESKTVVFSWRGLSNTFAVGSPVEGAIETVNGADGDGNPEDDNVMGVMKDSLEDGCGQEKKVYMPFIAR